VIIKAAKRIFNSDKICCSYYDFYFGVTFLEHTVLKFNVVFRRRENYMIYLTMCAKLHQNQIIF